MGIPDASTAQKSAESCYGEERDMEIVGASEIVWQGCLEKSRETAEQCESLKHWAERD